ncbi:MAG: Omp28-related outer membrane protein [Bacteroidota bacterium]
MKFAFFIPLSVIVLFSACTKEIGPAIDFSKVQAKDTFYMAPVENAQLKNVLIEEFTGVKCPNCPDGHNIVATIQNANPSRVIAIGYYPFGQAQTEPLKDLTKADFRIADATELSTLLGGIQFLPIAAVDRKMFGGAILTARTLWSSNVQARLAVATPINMQLSVSYDDASREAIIKTTLKYTSALSTKHNISLAIYENNLVDAQEYPTYIESSYTFKHVLRDVITPVGGASVLDSLTTKVAGLVFEKTILYTLPAKWNPSNCKIVAFVHDAAATKEVYQVIEKSVK